MNILVTGGTGFIGRHLIASRLQAGDNLICLSRTPEKVNEMFAGRVRGIGSLEEISGEPVDAVVNLAGAPIADRRWTGARKQLLRDSRLHVTRQLVNWIAQAGARPEVLISGSAIGYYGSQKGDSPLDESGETQPGFSHQLCQDWESAASEAAESGVRVCLIRTGVVLGQGGALDKMLPPFRFGLGGPIGNGRQWMSWIHLQDHIRAVEFLLSHTELSGAFNLTAPQPVRNSEFASLLGEVLGKPARLPVPGFVIKLMLGEGAELLLEGQRVYPHRLLDTEFSFGFPQLEDALRSLLSGSV